MQSLDPFDRDPFDEDEREALRFLREQHLDGIAADEQRAIATAIDQTRFLIITASTLVAASLNNLPKSIQKHDDSFFTFSIAAVLGSITIALAFFANETSISLRHSRVNRRFKVLKGFTAGWLEARRDAQPPHLNSAHDDRQEAFRGEQKAFKKMQALRVASLTSLVSGVFVFALALLLSFPISR